MCFNTYKSIILQSLPILDVLSNLVSVENTMSLDDLPPQNSFGQDLLNGAEGIGLYLSILLENMNNPEEMVVATNNFGER